MMIVMARNNRQAGLTLIEILVALTISVFLLSGLFQLFIGARQSARVQENLSRVQENGRFATEYLSRVVRLAGYRSRTTIEGGQTFEQAFPAIRSIQGTDNSGANNSDVITVNFEGENVAQGEVRDCLNTLITAPATSSNILSINGNTLQCQTPANTQPVVDNVENIQILYGEDTTGSGVANRYVTAAQVSNWNRVVSARISLLLRTAENNLAEAPQPYTFNGATVTPPAGDRRLRRVFTTTVTLRNRV